MSLKDVAVYINYISNLDFIASNLCINRNKPELMCSGKCYLNKMLTESNKHEKSLPGPLKVKDSKAEIIIDNIRIEDFFIPTYSINSSDESKQITYLARQFNSENIFEIFHPPQIFLS